MSPKFRKFQPMALEVSHKIKMLLDRGGRVINERKEFVEVQRQDSIAKIDQWGRVDWRAK